MYFDRFDICEAYYLFGSEYHSGQFSHEYRYMGRALNLGFTVRLDLAYAKLTENGRAIYDNLVAKTQYS